jgi:hypothetical protein
MSSISVLLLFDLYQPRGFEKIKQAIDGSLNATAKPNGAVQPAKGPVKILPNIYKGH